MNNPTYLYKYFSIAVAPLVLPYYDRTIFLPVLTGLLFKVFLLVLSWDLVILLIEQIWQNLTSASVKRMLNWILILLLMLVGLFTLSLLHTLSTFVTKDILVLLIVYLITSAVACKSRQFNRDDLYFALRLASLTILCFVSFLIYQSNWTWYLALFSISFSSAVLATELAERLCKNGLPEIRPNKINELKRTLTLLILLGPLSCLVLSYTGIFSKTHLISIICLLWGASIINQIKSREQIAIHSGYIRLQIHCNFLLYFAILVGLRFL